jgi:methyl-accepting chemotaxis protein
MFRFMFLRYLGIDLLVGVVLAILWLLLYDTPKPITAMAVCAGLYLVRFSAWVVHLRVALAPLTAWQQSSSDNDALYEIQARLRQLPTRLTTTLVLGWGGYYTALAALAWWVIPDVIHIGRAELLAATLQTLTVTMGSWLIYRLLSQVMVDVPMAKLDRQLRRRGLAGHPAREPLGRRLMLVGAGLVIVPLVWGASMSWLREVRSSREVTSAELRGELEHAALLRERGQAPPEHVEVVETLPPEFSPSDAEQGVATRIDRQRERVAVAVRSADGHWLATERVVEFGWAPFFRDFGLLLFVATVWGVATLTTQSYSILGALGRLGRATRRLVEVGDLRDMDRVPVVTNDEIGDLSRDFNDMLETYGTLATAAERVALGDLSLTIEGRGDLSSAFTRMVAQLHELVVRLRETATSLTGATSEIQAATSELERAAARQSDEMTQLDESMASLANSASQIDDSSKGVLDNAERTLTNADETTSKMHALGQRIEGIESLLDQIREIADRSDLLALNGSLEATRAGEDGRGFTLVAAEMRRLAERVTDIVNDARGLVVDINAANTSTATTTERSRELAEKTAAAARAIADQTRHQSADTEHASTNVREVAIILAHTTTAVVQTRAIANELGVEAQRLEQLLANFELREGEGRALVRQHDARSGRPQPGAGRSRPPGYQ